MNKMIEIDELIKEYEKDPIKAKAIAEARIKIKELIKNRKLIVLDHGPYDEVYWE